MCRLLRAIVVLVLMVPALVPALVMAQAQVPAGYDEGPTRVLQIERIEGLASVQRGGKTVALQGGFLIFNDERVMLAPESRASLLLARHGHLEFLPESGPGALIVQKLPFSSWAVDLETALRVDGGALRVRWVRPAHADDWPLAVLVGRWRAQLGNGEFLFRSATHGAEVCNVSGAIEVLDESAAWRGAVPVGQCFALREGDPPTARALASANWTELLSPTGPADGRMAQAEALASGTPPEAGESAANAQPPMPVVSAPAVVVAESAPAAEAGATPASAPASAAETAGSELAQPVVAAPVAAVTPTPAPPAEAAPAESDAQVSVVAPPVSMRRLADAVSPTNSSAPAPSSTAPANGAEVLELPADPVASGPEWIVNVMTLADPLAASEHVQRLTTAGYPALLRAEQVRGRASYRVIVAGLSSDQAASRMVELLRKNLGYTAAWSLQKR